MPGVSVPTASDDEDRVANEEARRLLEAEADG
jgi:hypothetical protein